MAYGTTQKGSDGLPLGSVQVPGQANVTPLMGGTISTDANSNTAAPAVFQRDDGRKATYGVGVVGLVPGASPTDIFTITGSATKVVKITKLYMVATATATGNSLNVLLLKRSTANTGGTSSTQTAAPFDRLSAAATAVCTTYTANPTALGTGVIGYIQMARISVLINTTAQPVEFITDWGIRPSQCPTLRGTSDLFCINLIGSQAAQTGWAFNIWCEFTEE